MRLIVELDVQDKDVPVWSHSTGITSYSNRSLKGCKDYVKYFLENRAGIKIINIKKIN